MGLLKRVAAKGRTVRHLALLRVRNPSRRRSISRAIALTLPRGDGAAGAELAREVQHQGYVLLDQPFDSSKLRSIRAQLERRPCTDGWRPERGVFPLERAPADSNNVQILDPESIREAVEIANDPRILAIAAAYLGCKPTIDDIVAWWSLPNRPAPFEEQFFHRDQDSIRFLKLFVCLSDVTHEDGPHVFVRGSHQSDILLDRGRRFDDDEVLKHVSAEDIVTFTGPFGTVFIEDTYGLHKGQMPTTGTRLMLQVRYTIVPSMFATPGKKNADVSGFDPYINRLIARR